MKFQVCSNCNAEIDLTYAACPNCGSLSMHESSYDDETWEKLDPLNYPGLYDEDGRLTFPEYWDE